MPVFNLNMPMIDKGRIEINLDREFPNEKTILDFLQSGQLYEPDVFHAFVRLLEKGDRVFDVGANIGFFTLLSAALVGPEGAVVSFEPDAENIKRLSANIDLNGLNNVTTIERPASDKVEQVGFYINSDNSGGNSLWDPALFPGNDESKANPKRLDMQTTTLAREADALDAGDIKLIKVDTEGAEQLILQGAKEILEGVKVPFVISELHQFGLERMGCSPKSLREFMEGMGYSTFALTLDGSLPKFIPPKTEISTNHIINLLFSTPDLVSKYWPVEFIQPV